MTPDMNRSADANLLADLDAERRVSGTPSERGDLVREWSGNRSTCRITFVDAPPERIDDLIRYERDAARAGGYSLEWKLYEHDLPDDLPARLISAGFEAEDLEDVMFLPLDRDSLTAFDGRGHEVRIVQDERGLDDYAEISRDIGRRNVEEEQRALAIALREHPDELRIHIAYIDGEPVSSGRTHLRRGGPYAELAGGRTKTTYRRRGLYTSTVASRLQEARDRDRTHALVDALPTSAPILRKLGFKLLTRTQPYIYQ